MISINIIKDQFKASWKLNNHKLREKYSAHLPEDQSDIICDVCNVILYNNGSNDLDVYPCATYIKGHYSYTEGIDTTLFILGSNFKRNGVNIECAWWAIVANYVNQIKLGRSLYGHDELGDEIITHEQVETMMKIAYDILLTFKIVM